VAERQGLFFYGWVIVALTFVIQFLAMGSTFYVFGVLLKPLTEALEADRFLVSLGLSSQMVVGALLGPWLGNAVAKYPIRPLMTVGIVLLAVGLVAVSQSTQLWHFYLAFALLTSVGFTLAGPLPNAALVANWFTQKRGTAMGISQFGVTFSGALLVPLFTWLMIDFGWRSALVMFAVGVTVIGLPAIWIGLVKTPEEKQLAPDGVQVSTTFTDAKPKSNSVWTFRRALAEKDIWLIAIVMGSGFITISAVLLSIHSHMTDAGMSDMRASTIIAAMTLTGAIAKPLFGILTDYLNKKLVIFISIGAQFFGVSGFVLFDSYISLIFAAGLFGFGYGAQMPLFNILVATIYGREDFPRVIGLMGPMMLPFNMLGLPVATLVYERFGSYIPAYAGVLVFCLVATICLSFLKIENKEVN
tara:strand:- start:341 stop:1585 length:1245 start_codon:yes stop_codon:yes gene_type:complete